MTVKKEPPYKAILFACDANTCRSPLAEALLIHMLSHLGIDGQIQVRSGGIAPHARDGSLISLDMIMIMKENNIPFPEDFRSKALQRHPELIEEADLILTMTHLQKERMQQLEEIRGKELYTLKEFIGESGDIRDPEGEGESAYETAKKEIERCLRKVVVRLLPTNH